MKKPIRIAVDGRFARQEPLTGVGLFARELTRNLVRRSASSGLDIREFTSRFPLDAHPWGDLWLHGQFPKRAAAWEAGIIFSPAYYLPYASPGCRRVVVIHDLAAFLWPQTLPPSFRWYLRQMVRLAVRKADHLCTVSEAIRQELLDLFPILPPERVTSVFEALPRTWQAGSASNAPFPESLKAQGVQPPYLLAVGSLDPRKNLANLLAAFDKVRQHHPHLQLVLAGAQGGDGAVRRALATFPQGATLLLGYVPEEELCALYRHARLFVFPSWYEGFGLPLLEALSCGTRVAVSDIPAFREILGTEAGSFFPPGDHEAIARVLLEALASPASLDAPLRARGREVLERFTWDRTCEMIETCFRRVSDDCVSPDHH